MFVVLFEVMPKDQLWDAYLAAAKKLKPILEQIDGFIDNTRYRSLTRSDVILSLSTWESEKALIRWRTVGLHHDTQGLGRNAIFADYRLRVAAVTYDSADPTVAERQRRFDGTEIGTAPFVVLHEGWDAVTQGTGERFVGVLDERQDVVVCPADNDDVRRSSRDPQPDGRVRIARVIREYGMYDRREAPQYFPPVRATL